MKTSTSILLTVLLCATAPLLRAQPPTKDIVEVVKETTSRGKPLHGTFLKLVEASGLAETLKTGGPYTVFAPTDAAFAALPAGKIEGLLKPENKQQLVSLLKHHIVSGKIVESELAKQTEVTPLEGAPLKVTTKNNLVKKVGDADTSDDQHEASNGIVYRVKSVLLP